MHVVRPRDGGEAARQVELLIPGEDEDGDHAPAIVSRSFSVLLILLANQA